MMTLQRNMTRTLVVLIGMTMLLLLSLELFFAMVNEMRQVGTGHYALNDAIVVLLMSVPTRVYQMFPMSALVGALMGLGVMASHSELIAMRAAGVSIWQIVGMVLKIGAVLAIIVWLIGELVAPVCDRFAQNHKAYALSGGQALRTEHGIWIRDGHDFIHINNMHISGLLEGVVRYRFDDDLHLKEASYAEEAQYRNKEWTLYNIRKSFIEDDVVTTEHVAEQPWDSDIKPEVLRVAGVKYLDQLSLIGLWHTIAYRDANGLDTAPYALALWEKLMQPAATLVMMFLSVPFIFGPLRRATMGFRLLAGILVGFGFHTFNASFGPFSLVYALPPWLGATLPTLTFFVIGALAMRRIR